MRAIRHDAAVDETRRPFAIGDVVIGGQKIDVFGLAQPRDQGVLLADRRPPVDDLGLGRMPAKRAAACALCSVSAARIRVFDGTQPMLTHVPPIMP